MVGCLSQTFVKGPINEHEPTLNIELKHIIYFEDDIYHDITIMI